MTAHHTIFCLDSAPERRAALQGAVDRLGKHADHVLVLPSGIGSLDRYVIDVQAIFPITSPVGTPRATMSWDQV